MYDDTLKRVAERRGHAGEEPQRTRLGSMGAAVVGVQAEVRDLTGAPLPPGEVGRREPQPDTTVSSAVMAALSLDPGAALGALGSPGRYLGRVSLGSSTPESPA